MVKWGVGFTLVGVAMFVVGLNIHAEGLLIFGAIIGFPGILMLLAALVGRGKSEEEKAQIFKGFADKYEEDRRIEREQQLAQRRAEKEAEEWVRRHRQ